MVLHDLSSSHFEGTTCPLAKRGYGRDGRPGTLQVNYGLLTDRRSCPVAVPVHEGNTADSRTFMPAVQKLRDDFGVRRMVMVGDRGMVSQKAIDEMRETEGIGWITALKSASIRALVEQGHLQIDLFYERNLLEISSPDYPSERLVACRNGALAKLRADKRQDLLTATECNLDKIKAGIDVGELSGRDKIGVRVGKVINQYKVANHFGLRITDTALSWALCSGEHQLAPGLAQVPPDTRDSLRFVEWPSRSTSARPTQVGAFRQRNAVAGADLILRWSIGSMLGNEVSEWSLPAWRDVLYDLRDLLWARACSNDLRIRLCARTSTKGPRNEAS